jgi:hypothetical protein
MIGVSILFFKGRLNMSLTFIYQGMHRQGELYAEARIPRFEKKSSDQGLHQTQ